VIIKRHLTANYTVIDNAVLQDEGLSWKATGLLAYLLSLPTDWSVNLTDLTRRKTDGRTATENAFAELRTAGYIEVRAERQPNGRVASVCHVFDLRGLGTLLATDGNEVQTGGLTGPRETRTSDKPDAGKPGVLVSTQVENTQDKESKDLAKREFDAVWDGLVLAFGDPPESQRALRARIVRSLASMGAGDMNVLKDRIMAWPAHFGEATLTETALEKHWNRLGLPPRRATRAQAESAERAEDRAGLAEELANE